MKKIIISLILPLASIVLLNAQSAPSTSLAKSVGLYVFPAKNQKPEQQSKDDDECYKWAITAIGLRSYQSHQSDRCPG